MNRDRHARIRKHVLWLLDEADRLDRAADDLEDQPKPPPVADVTAMDLDWITGTVGPDRLRQTANEYRVLAARVPRPLTEQENQT